MIYGRFAPWTFRPQSWTFRPLDGSPPGRFATRTVRPLDVSPPGRFALWTIRHLDVSPICDGRFAPKQYRPSTHWKLRCKVYFCGYATRARLLKSVSRLTMI